jgi:hypothetical protein
MKHVPLNKRVRASEERKIAAGGRRLPGGILAPEAVAAIDRLRDVGYAPSAMQVISRAVVEAAQQVKTK